MVCFVLLNKETHTEVVYVTLRTSIYRNLCTFISTELHTKWTHACVCHLLARSVIRRKTLVSRQHTRAEFVGNRLRDIVGWRLCQSNDIIKCIIKNVDNCTKGEKITGGTIEFLLKIWPTHCQSTSPFLRTRLSRWQKWKMPWRSAWCSWKS